MSYFGENIRDAVKTIRNIMNPTAPTMNCPKCSEPCNRDEVDNGVAILLGPWGCECGWIEWKNCHRCGLRFETELKECPYCEEPSNMTNDKLPPPGGIFSPSVIEFQERLENAFSKPPQNLTDNRHPHEPEIPPVLASDGRCLVCALMVERDQARESRAFCLEEIERKQGMWKECFDLYRKEKRRADAMEERLKECVEYMKGYDSEEPIDCVARARRTLAYFDSLEARAIRATEEPTQPRP